MIWYFSGSGNSQHVAKKLAEAASCKTAPIERISAAASDDIWGLVFPVYCCGLPEIVVRFLRDEANLPGPGDYVVLAATCGVSSGMALRQATELLAERGVSVDASFVFRMADNDATLYDMDADAASAANLAAEPDISAAAELIAQRGTASSPEDDPLEAAQKRYRFYDEKRRCEHLSASSACVACGFCAMACPDGAITFVNNRPAWTAERCQMCLRCLHHCPKGGITYDGVNRGQYIYSD